MFIPCSAEFISANNIIPGQYGFTFYVKELRQGVYRKLYFLEKIINISRIRHFNFNPYPAEKIKMPRPLLIFSQSDYLIQIVDINLHT